MFYREILEFKRIIFYISFRYSYFFPLNLPIIKFSHIQQREEKKILHKFLEKWDDSGKFDNLLQSFFFFFFLHNCSAPILNFSKSSIFFQHALVRDAGWLLSSQLRFSFVSNNLSIFVHTARQVSR